MIRDMNVTWLEKRVWLPVAGIALSETTTPTVFRTWVSSSSITAQVASSRVTNVVLTAQNDGLGWGMMVPYDLDITKQVRFRVHFTQTADSGTVTFALAYTPIIAGTTVIAVGGTALDTVIPAYTTALATDNVWLVTDFGIIKRNTLPDTTDALTLLLTCTDATPNAGLGVLGLEMRYTPRRTQGQERNLLGGKRLVTNRPLGVQLNTTQEGR
jgi:hypothetical protein